MNLSRRGFIGGLAGASAFAAGGGWKPFGRQKVKLAAVGVGGKGYTDWTAMLATGFVEIVAFCDADYAMREKIQTRLAEDGVQFDMYRVPFYTDYRKLLDDAGALGIEAMTISTPDHVHAPVAIGAMKQGIHVYVQKPLVRTLWELDYFERTARENGVITQMGNQGSAFGTMRRCTEVIQSGMLGDVREVHVWTDRPVWPQGKAVADWVKGHPRPDRKRPGLNWDAWLATAKGRPFLDKYPDDADVYDPWNLGKNVYHTFTWRGFYDFGAGAFGDMACHTLNLAFRGLELGAVTEAECVESESFNDIAYPLKSKVKLVYAARESKLRKGAALPPVTLYWYDGGLKPSAAMIPKWAASHGGKVPKSGCYIIGSRGEVLMQDDYGRRCAMSLDGERGFTDISMHEAAKSVPRSIPCFNGEDSGSLEPSVEMKGLGTGHYTEFINAIRGEGPYYSQTHSRCFSDIEYSIPQMEGILIGCVAQRIPGQKLAWDSAARRFDNEEANGLVRPFIRSGWEF